MSGQWEVVGKKRSKENVSSNKKSIGESKKKSNIPTILKVEDVLPSKEVKSLFSSNKNKENRKPVEKSKVQENGTAKKAQKKVEKPVEVPKSKQPKTIESALNMINLDEFKAVYENNKVLFPGAPLVWLKELAKFLNHQVPIDIQDPTFSTKPDYYPYSIVPASIRNVISQSVKQAGQNNAQLFFDMALTSMANDMSKNLSAIGYKLYLQHLAASDPTFVVTNLSKHTILRNSYQNRQPIGLSILWAVGQAAPKSLNIGIKVFEEMMLPVIEMKNYSRYVVQYLISLFNYHEKERITLEQYLLILDVAFANYKNFPTDLRKEVQKVVVKIGTMLLSHRVKEKSHTFIEPFLKKMLSNNNEGYRKALCEILISVLTEDQTAFATWSKCYMKYLPQSAILLKYIEENWNTLSTKLNRTALSELLDTYQGINEELLTKKRKEPGLSDCITSIKNLKHQFTNKKMVYNHSSYKRRSFILLFIIGVLVYRDIQQHGSWERSVTYKGLKNYGILNYTDKAFQRSREGLQWLHIRIEEQFPGYYEKSAELLHPYAQLSRDLAIILRNNLLHLKEVIVTKYYPALISTIDTYAPGLFEASQKAVVDAWKTTVIYVARGINYLKKEFFVGQLSPENIQRVLFEALNTTQRTAAQCYNWMYERVQSIIK